MSLKKYFDIQENILKTSKDYFIRKLRGLLEESAKLRTIADVLIGTFLSREIDSTSVVALTKPNVGYNLHTFSMGFGEHFSELEYAKITAEHLDMIHHEIVMDSNDIIKEFGKIAWHYDELLGDVVIIANYIFCKTNRR